MTTELLWALLIAGAMLVVTPVFVRWHFPKAQPAARRRILLGYYVGEVLVLGYWVVAITGSR